MYDINGFADLNYSVFTKLGYTTLTFGIDHYRTLEEVDIDFANGLEYKYNDLHTVGKLQFTHQWNNFYLRFKTDTQDRVTGELGFTIKL